MAKEIQVRLMRRDSVILASAVNGKIKAEIYQSIDLEERSEDALDSRTIHGSLDEFGNMICTGTEPTPPMNWKDILGKVMAILGLLYFFVCSLGFLSDSFRLIAGRAAGEVLQQDKLISNPVVGVMMGILVTVAVQSSSTSTSIVVSMVASGLFPVRTAIPIIMGANIGTSVTNTVVALTHMSNRHDFERAFGGAVLHDMFNLLTVTVLLILEQFTRYLEVTTTAILENFELTTKKGGEIQVLSVLTKPFTSLIIQVNKDVIVGWSIKDPAYDDARLLKLWCNTTTNGETKIARKCRFLFNVFEMSDLTVGIILLVISLILLCGCLVCLVKVLSTLLRGKLALAVQKGVNANIPYVPCLTGYLAIGIGAVMTILVQSSSVFTSAMTPLIAMGMISLERAYPLTLGSNLGTTTTAMLAALAAEGPNLKWSIQLALCHFLFNLTGIALFYPIPFMRFPIRMAAGLGRVTAKYRWFAVFYLIFMFLILPLLVFMLSMLGTIAFYTVSIPMGCIAVFVVTLNFLQSWTPTYLPVRYRNWAFLPIWFHSLEPYDRIVQFLIRYFKEECCHSCFKKASGSDVCDAGKRAMVRNNSSTVGLDNLAFNHVMANESDEVNGLGHRQTEV